MEIPKRFKIAGHDYKIIIENIVYDYDKESVFGYHDNVKLEIRIAKRVLIGSETIVLTPTQIENTFFHELFHAFNYYWNNEQDESLAQVFSNFMCEFERTKE